MTLKSRESGPRPTLRREGPELLVGSTEAKSGSPEGFSSAEVSMLRDIDDSLARLEDGISKERKAMNDLFERIRQPAA